MFTLVHFVVIWYKYGRNISGSLKRRVTFVKTHSLQYFPSLSLALHGCQIGSKNYVLSCNCYRSLAPSDPKAISPFPLEKDTSLSAKSDVVVFVDFFLIQMIG